MFNNHSRFEYGTILMLCTVAGVNISINVNDTHFRDALVNKSPLRYFLCNGAVLAPKMHVSLYIGQSIITLEENNVFSTDSINVYKSSTKWILVAGNTDNTVTVSANTTWNEVSFTFLKDCISESVLDLFMQLFRFVFETFMAYDFGLSLHASCIVYNNKAICFSARSGIGKSTQAELWEKYRQARTLNHDRPMIKSLGNGQYNVYGMPWSGTTVCYHNDTAPLKAIVMLKQALHNKCYKLSKEVARQMMLRRVSMSLWDEEAVDSCLSTVSSIINDIPIFLLYCLPDESSVNLLGKVLENMSQIYELEKSEQVLRVKSGYLLKKVIDDYIVVLIGQNAVVEKSILVLDGCAAFIWQMLEKPVTKKELIRSIMNEYDVDQDTVITDLDGFLDQLNSKKLLVFEDVE